MGYDAGRHETVCFICGDGRRRGPLMSRQSGLIGITYHTYCLILLKEMLKAVG